MAADIKSTLQSWTIRQIVHHVVDGDDLWKSCIKASLGSNEPFSVNWYWDISQERWSEIWVCAKREIEPSLRLLHANGNSIGQLLRLIPGALEREVIVKWPDAGEQRGTIGDVIRMQISHVAEHVDDINRIREAHGFNQKLLVLSRAC